MWRPQGWDKVIETLLDRDHYPDIDGYYSNTTLIEAGADAMLEALLKNGIPSESVIGINEPLPYATVNIPTLQEFKRRAAIENYVLGHWVFIPDVSNKLPV